MVNGTNYNNRFFVRNFRPVAGVGTVGTGTVANQIGTTTAAQIYRCGSTDVLGARIRNGCNNTAAVDTGTTCTGSSETAHSNNISKKNGSNENDNNTIVQRDAGLVIDLRSAPERREADALLWMKEVSDSDSSRPIRVITVAIPLDNEDSSTTVSQSATITRNSNDNDNSNGNGNGNDNDNDINNFFGGNANHVGNSRYVVRLDVLNRAELLGYVRKQWLTNSNGNDNYTNFPETEKEIGANQNHNRNQIMTELNKRGLAGLNEAILETNSGKRGMCLALQLMTLYREATAAGDSSITQDQYQNQNQSSSSSSRSNGSIVFHCVQGKDRCV